MAWKECPINKDAAICIFRSTHLLERFMYNQTIPKVGKDRGKSMEMLLLQFSALLSM